MFFHGGSTNRGCEAIVRAGVNLLKNENKNAVVDLASMDPTTDLIIPNIDKIYLDDFKPLKKFSFDWFISSLRVKFLKDENYAYKKMHKDIIALAPKYDILLSIGGDNYCYGEIPSIYVLNKEIKKAGKKMVLWGASIGEEDLTPAKIEDLKSYDLILARETLTERILKDNGIEKVKLCADGAFTMEKEELTLPEGWEENKMIGFNYSPLVLKKNPESKKAAFALIKHILDSTNFKIALTPHVIQPGNDDHEALMEFYNAFKDTNRIILLPNNLNAIQYKGYIARMRFFIGARTHATIAAYSSLVPTMVLGYSVKSKGIANDIFGEQKLVLSLEEISNSEKLIQKFKEMIAEEETLKQILQNRIPEIKEMSKKAAKELFEIE